MRVFQSRVPKVRIHDWKLNLDNLETQFSTLSHAELLFIDPRRRTESK